MATFHIGLHKTASTWLQERILWEHPKVELLNDVSRPWTAPLIRWLALGEGTIDSARTRLGDHGKGSGLLVSAERLSGHPASGWHDREEIAGRIARLDPEAKIVMVVRDQKSILLPIYRQLIRVGWTMPLGRMLEADSWNVPSFSLDGLDYAARAESYSALLGRGAVGVLKFETLQSDPRKFLGALWEFIGVPSWFPDDRVLRTPVNSTPRHGTEARRWLNHLRRSPLNPSPVVDLTGIVRSRPMKSLLSQLPADAGLPPGLASRIDARFLASNERLRSWILA